MYIVPGKTLLDILGLAVVAIMEYSLVLMFYSNFFRLKKKSLALRVVAVLVFAGIMTCVNLLGYAYINTLVAVVLVYSFSCLLFTGPWVPKIKFCIIYLALSIIAEIGSGLVVSQIGEWLPKYKKLLVTIFAMSVISKIVLLIIIANLIHFFPKRYRLSENNGSVWLLVFPVLGIVNMYILLYMEEGQSSFRMIMLLLLVLGAMLPISTLAPLLINDSNIEHNRLMGELRISKEREQANDVFSREQERNLEELRRRTHDFKNQLINFRDLYGPGTPEAEKYYSSLMDSLNAQVNFHAMEIGNKVVSNIIGRVRRQCKQNNIRFDMHLDCNSLSFIELLDASAIFDNAFDNAIYACTEVPQPEKRWIVLSVQERNYFVLIKVENSKQNVVKMRGDKLLTTKSNSAEHGFGVENIRSVAEKYGGDILCEYDDSSFTLSVHLSKQTDNRK